MVRAAPWFGGSQAQARPRIPEGEAAAGRGGPAKSHKCTLIPSDIKAARGAGKLDRGPAGERAVCARGLCVGGGVSSQHSGGLWRATGQKW